MKKQFPYHGSCFVCGDENPHGFGLTWFIEDGIITSEFVLNEFQQGPPNHVHGGASAAILDEAMGFVIWAAGHKVVAANLNINYLKPLPLNQKLFAEARVTKVGKKKIISAGEIRLADSTVCVTGSGIYVVAHHLFEEFKIKQVRFE